MTAETRKPDILDGLKIIDCDSHFTEPPDLWTSRAPTSMMDRVPVHGLIEGSSWWFLDGEPWATIGGNTIEAGRKKVHGAFIVQPFDKVDPCAWMVKERLSLLDDIGIHAQILYPNGIGFSSNNIFAIDDEKQRLSVLQIYNDFLVDLQHESNNRLFPQAMLPIWDMDLTIREMTRLIERGITGFTMTDRPEIIGLPELPEPYFDPMWDLFNESGTVPNFHIGSGRSRDESEAYRRQFTGAQKAEGADPTPAGRPTANPAWSWFGWQRKMAVGAVQQYMSNIRVIANLCFSNLFDRYPKLKIVSAESGIGWVPFLLESMDFQFDEMVTSKDEVALAKRRPSEYYYDHIYVMFWYERLAAERMLDAIGVNNVLVETDIPHPTCYYPGAREHFAGVLAGVSPEIRQRVLQDNAAELYGIDLPSEAGAAR